MIYRSSASKAAIPMVDVHFAALFNHNRESSMDQIALATVNPNRFQACGRVTSFLGFDTVLYRRVRGRFGGDAGNRKRREELRHENDIEHRLRARNEKRAAQQAIKDGLEEYRLERSARLAPRAKLKASTHESRKGEAQNEEGSFTPRLRRKSDRKGHGEQLPPNLIRQGRTGHIVEVVRITRRTLVRPAFMPDIARPAFIPNIARPRLSTDQIRTKLGLPARA
jgi:hypothetical protein